MARSAESAALGQVLDCPEDVDRALDRARSAGARILKDPQDAAYGGYHGYFADAATPY